MAAARHCGDEAALLAARERHGLHDGEVALLAARAVTYRESCDYGAYDGVRLPGKPAWCAALALQRRGRRASSRLVQSFIWYGLVKAFTTHVQLGNGAQPHGYLLLLVQLGNGTRMGTCGGSLLAAPNQRYNNLIPAETSSTRPTAGATSMIKPKLCHQHKPKGCAHL